MAGTDDYGQGVSIAALTDAPNAEILAKNLGNAIVSRSAMRFASASARTAALTGVSAPVEGMVTYLQDTDLLYLYTGTAWRAVAPYIQTGTVNISFTNLDQYNGTTVTFPVAFSVAPIVGVNINSTSGATSRWTARAADITSTNFKPFFQSGTSGALATWSTIPVQWWAFSA